MLPANQTPFLENTMSVTPPAWKNNEVLVPHWFSTASENRKFSEGR